MTRYHDVASAVQPVKTAERSAIRAFLRILIAPGNVISCIRISLAGAFAPVIAALWKENHSPKRMQMIPMQRVAMWGSVYQKLGCDDLTRDDKDVNHEH